MISSSSHRIRLRGGGGVKNSSVENLLNKTYRWKGFQSVQCLNFQLSCQNQNEDYQLQLSSRSFMSKITTITFIIRCNTIITIKVVILILVIVFYALAQRAMKKFLYNLFVVIIIILIISSFVFSGFQKKWKQIVICYALCFFNI